MSRLFTPGPLCVSDGVRKAMNFDVGSRDAKFLETIVFIRKSLLEILHVNETTHTSILLQGAGSYAVEAVFANAIGKNDKKKVFETRDMRSIQCTGTNHCQRSIW